MFYFSVPARGVSNMLEVINSLCVFSVNKRAERRILESQALLVHNTMKGR